MKNNSENDALREYLENQVKKFEQHSYYLEKLRKIFTELNLAYVKDRCDGFCPECELMLECEGYDEEEWEGFYT